MFPRSWFIRHFHDLPSVREIFIVSLMVFPEPMDKNYQLALLCLTHLLISADGVEHENEIDALKIIKTREGVEDSLYRDFQQMVLRNKEREIYQHGIDNLNQCSDHQKLNVFVTLYKLSEVDGRVHVKEIRLLLYSIKLAGVEFNDVVNRAMASPSLI
jgi:uncharacterized tellurite resistance protein B-like protein